MNKFSKDLIAPCGMNCGVCLHYLRAENKCPGCFTGRKVNDKRIKCARRLCKKRTGDFCLPRAESKGEGCDQFPCESITKLDERYRKRYGMSEIENLEFIKKHGIEKFIQEQEEKYCKDGKTFCVHDGNWYNNL